MASVVAEFKALRLRLGLSQKAAVAEVRGLREVAGLAELQTVDLAKFELRHSEAAVKRFLPAARAWIQVKRKEDVAEGDCEVVEVKRRERRFGSKEPTPEVIRDNVVAEQTAIAMKDVRKVLVKEEVGMAAKEEVKRVGKENVGKEAFQEALGKVKGEAATGSSVEGRRMPMVRLKKVALPQSGEPAPSTLGTRGTQGVPEPVGRGTPRAPPSVAPGAPALPFLAPGSPAPLAVTVKQEPVLVALEARQGVEQGAEPECIDLEEEEEKEYR